VEWLWLVVPLDACKAVTEENRNAFSFNNLCVYCYPSIAILPAPYTFRLITRLCPYYILCVYCICHILHTLPLVPCPSMSEFLYSFFAPHPYDRIITALSLTGFLENNHHKPGYSSTPTSPAAVCWTNAHEFLNFHEYKCGEMTSLSLYFPSDIAVVLVTVITSSV
jgi:hypothetical protein